MRTIRAVDLFCGAGGSSSGLAQACAELGYRLDLTAINHWQVSVATHAANHPDARHLCESTENLDPRKVWADNGKLDILWASPECTHHSVARGGAPINDQSRASAWHVIRWAEALRPSADPFMLPMNGERPGQRARISAVMSPLPTQTTVDRFGLVEPFTLGQQSCAAACAASLPLATVATAGAIGLVEPFTIPITHGGATKRCRAISEPLPTLTTAHRGEQALIEPFLTKAYGTATVASMDEPVPTVTTRDRFGLVEQSGYDIRFRMLQPHELAAAMGFDGYRFVGNKGDQVRQIGNAVSVRTARALCLEVLES